MGPQIRGSPVCFMAWAVVCGIGISAYGMEISAYGMGSSMEWALVWYGD